MVSLGGQSKEYTWTHGADSSHVMAECADEAPISQTVDTLRLTRVSANENSDSGLENGWNSAYAPGMLLLTPRSSMPPVSKCAAKLWPSWRCAPGLFHRCPLIFHGVLN